MTYDNADEVKMMARNHGFQMRLIPMTNTHHATMQELVIGERPIMDGSLHLQYMSQSLNTRQKAKKEAKGVKGVFILAIEADFFLSRNRTRFCQ